MTLSYYKEMGFVSKVLSDRWPYNASVFFIPPFTWWIDKIFFNVVPFQWPATECLCVTIEVKGLVLLSLCY